MSLKLVDYESLNGDVTKCQYTIRGENQVNAGSVPIPVSGSSDQFLVLPETSFRGNYQR
ncbi:hypothetical protein F2Q69_00061368 [Brassica cretica]|uniref:Uncharacterized protein n=2 Tax=Brassica cretica TaxID=69181 RepID=A0A8S9RD08_BRACR|nr:hypothetical protein DY000_02004977 [Brassica cretica]KAF3570708.1 hypothetical protein F2Q69_00061368 [Brassica cretica]